MVGSTSGCRTSDFSRTCGTGIGADVVRARAWATTGNGGGVLPVAVLGAVPMGIGERESPGGRGGRGGGGGGTAGSEAATAGATVGDALGFSLKVRDSPVATPSDGLAIGSGAREGVSVMNSGGGGGAGAATAAGIIGSAGAVADWGAGAASNLGRKRILVGGASGGFCTAGTVGSAATNGVSPVAAVPDAGLSAGRSRGFSRRADDGGGGSSLIGGQ